MRIGGNNRGDMVSTGIDPEVLHGQLILLKDVFDAILVVNPISKTLIEVTEYGIKETSNSCCKYCPLVNDKCGCICTDTVSNKENRSRFIHNKTTAFLVISRPLKTKYKDFVLVLITKLNPSFAFGAIPSGEAIKQITEISSNLVIDPLTKIFNRKYITDNANFWVQECEEQGKAMCLACIDVDNFKRFNDTYGHEFGDKVLISIAQLMSKAISVIPNSYPIRIGGDEFIIVAMGIDKNRFKAIMTKLCIMVDDFKLKYENELVGIKISIGVSELLSDRLTSYKELYDKADSQLYEAKEAGKGCVR